MSDEPEDPFASRLPPQSQRESTRHTLAVMRANQELRQINALAEMETAILKDGAAGLESFFRGTADSCRGNAGLWSQMADHFDAMGRIVEENS